MHISFASNSIFSKYFMTSILIVNAGKRRVNFTSNAIPAKDHIGAVCSFPCGFEVQGLLLLWFFNTLAYGNHCIKETDWMDETDGFGGDIFDRFSL
jgi:hypothetical protein